MPVEKKEEQLEFEDAEKESLEESGEPELEELTKEEQEELEKNEEAVKEEEKGEAEEKEFLRYPYPYPYPYPFPRARRGARFVYLYPYPYPGPALSTRTKEIIFLLDKLIKGEDNPKAKAMLQEIKAIVLHAAGQFAYPYPTPYPYPKPATKETEELKKEIEDLKEIVSKLANSSLRKGYKEVEPKSELEKELEGKDLEEQLKIALKLLPRREV